MMNFQRLYHVSCINYSMKKQGVKLCKMINPKAQRQWFPSQPLDTDALPSLKSLTKVKNEPGKRGIRRIAMLNKIFMKQITDMMSTGTVSMNIVGRGIEISKVNVTPDFKTVNVFWVCKGDASDEETEAVLDKSAGALRHELSTLRIMGEIPYVVFVKDKLEARVVDLDKRLATADYGEDYTPTDLGHLLKSEFTSSTKLSPEMKAKIKLLEDELPIVDDPVPEMTHNIYGLDHAKIMNRLLGACKKSREAWSNLDADPNVISYRAGESTPGDVSIVNQKKELAEFLQKRQILQKKIQKQIHKSDENWQLELAKEGDEPEIVEDDDDEYYEDDEYDDLESEQLNYFLERASPPLKDSSTVA